MSGTYISNGERAIVDNTNYHRDRANKYLTWLIGIALILVWTKFSEYQKDRSSLPQEWKVIIYQKEESVDSFQCLDGLTSEHGSRICQVIGTTYDRRQSDDVADRDCFTTSFLISNLIMSKLAASAENGFLGDEHEVTQCGSFFRVSPGQSLDDWWFDPAKPGQTVVSLVEAYVQDLYH